MINHYKRNRYIFYGLFDKNGKIFYVGITVQRLTVRLRQHLQSAKIRGYLARTDRKIKKIYESNFKITIDKLHESLCTGEEALIKERAIIKEYINNGHDLTNHIIWIRKIDKILALELELDDQELINIEKEKILRPVKVCEISKETQFIFDRYNFNVNKNTIVIIEKCRVPELLMYLKKKHPNYKYKVLRGRFNYNVFRTV